MPNEWHIVIGTDRQDELGYGPTDCCISTDEMDTADAVAWMNTDRPDWRKNAEMIVSAKAAIARAEAAEASLAVEKMESAAALDALRRANERIADLESKVCQCRNGLQAVADLISESYGVDGLHCNGDLARWADLRTGGRYEEWLMAFDDAFNSFATETQLPPVPGE